MALGNRSYYEKRGEDIVLVRPALAVRERVVPRRRIEMLLQRARAEKQQLETESQERLAELDANIAKFEAALASE